MKNGWSKYPKTCPLWSGTTDFECSPDVRGKDASYLAPPAQIRTSPIRAYGLYGAFFVKVASLRHEHSSVPIAYFHRRCAQRPSRTDASTAAGCRHGRAMIRGEPAIGRDQSREPRLYSVEPVWVPTMKQSYASAGKAPRRRVHSPSGIAAIAECGLPPPRIVIGYPAHQAQSGAELCLSFLVLEYCSRRRPQLDTVRHLAGRD